ncbi:MAG: amidase family protein [Urechidicola sp.]|nr:amidase family protein [Urechidicola sp.]
MKTKLLIVVVLMLFSCQKEWNKELSDDTSAISVKDVEYKVLDSEFLNVDELWKPFEKYWEDFTEVDYNRLKPLILEQNIPTLQIRISKGKLTYEQLTLFYLYRIKKFDRLNELSLNSVIALNPNVVEEAKKADLTQFEVAPHPIFGMPILLKDNINAAGMPTTAGAIALVNNNTEDAFIVKQLKANGALILGKTNLSEWAYFFCGECPSGYSAVGGQTLNPYGRMVMDTGGSSSGSGVAAAANFAVGTVGSETSGSILSPASQNSVVGLKPTVGFLSRTGIVPISSTLDTPGPITRNVVDNAILFDAMKGYDDQDTLSFNTDDFTLFNDDFTTNKLERVGVFKELLKDSLYRNAVEILKQNGTTIVEIDEVEVKLNGFMTLLNLDMRNDLPIYLKNNADKTVAISSVQEVIEFNKKDSVLTMPYGQALFYGIVNDKTSDADFEQIKDSLHIKGKQFFDIPMNQQNLDAILSINNYHAGRAAVAKYPAITVPMGYTKEGKPKGLTFISNKGEKNLLNWADGYEHLSKERKRPENYN